VSRYVLRHAESRRYLHASTQRRKPLLTEELEEAKVFQATRPYVSGLGRGLDGFEWVAVRLVLGEAV
jgi:hypothetical protein